MPLSSFFEWCPCLLDIFLLIGLIFFLSIVGRFSYFIYCKFVRAPKDIYAVYGGPNTWAAVTGASDGIGKAFCEALAQRGFNICLIARNPEKLEKARQDILNVNPKISTAIVVTDFSLGPKDPLNFFSKIIEDMQKANVVDVAILVNNAGMIERGNFQDISLKGCADSIAVNVYPSLFLSKLLIPSMLKRSNRSLVINLSSITGVRPVPIRGAYGATKAFNDILARSLFMELDQKIDFLSVKPNYVSTNMTKMKVGGTVIRPIDVAEGALRDAGWQSATAGNWKHDVLEFLYKNVATDKMVARSALKRREQKEDAKID